MDQNNDWYERYSSYPPQNGNAGTPGRSERHGVRISTLIVFMMVAVLLGALIGGLYTRQYVGEQLTSAESSCRILEEKQNAACREQPASGIFMFTPLFCSHPIFG